MSTFGRPTDYKPEYCDLAHNYCLLGATNPELASFFGVVRRTVDYWIANHPEFAEAVRTGRAFADAGIARRLYQRAWGFSHEVTRKTLYQGDERTVTSTVSYPPDTLACMFWLRNRRRQDWRERAEPAFDSVTADMAALEAARAAELGTPLESTIEASGEEADHVDGR
jgi:hypothetical protein